MRSLLSPTLVASLGLTMLIAPSALSSEPAKDHHLIVGTDFTVKLDGQIHPVIGAGKRTFIVKRGEKTAELPLHKLKDIQFNRGLKLTRLAARIEKVDASMESDMAVAEQHEATQTSMAMTTMANLARDRALGKALDLEFSRGLYDSTSGVGGVQQTIAIIEARLHGDGGLQLGAWDEYARADRDIAISTSMRHDVMLRAATRTVNDGTEVELIPAITPNSVYLLVAGETVTKKVTTVAPLLAVDATKVDTRIVDAGGGRSDRFNLAFDVSAPERIDNAYLVLVTEFSPPERPNEVFRRVLTEKLGTLSPQRRRVDLFQTGFPPGFTVRTYVVTLFAEGQEIATNLSDAKMSMTREEAQQYVFAEHLAANKGKTLPPAAVLMAPRTQLRSLVSDPSARHPVYVSVDENGQVLNVSADSKGKQAPPAAVTNALQHFCFVPALKDGVPTPGRAKLVVTEFIR